MFFGTGVARAFLAAAGEVLVSSGKAEWPAGRRRLLVGVPALVVVLLDIALPIAVYGSTSWISLSTLVFTAATVLPVLTAAVRPLWAWRLAAVLLAALPFAHGEYARPAGWPWTPGLLLATAVALHAVARNHDRPALVGVFLITAGVVAAHVRDGGKPALATVVVAGVLALGNAGRLRRRAEAERAEQQRLRVAEQVRAATLEERALIARELHDVVAHHMSVLVLRSGSAHYRFPDLPAGLREEFAAIQDTAREGMTEMRRLLGVLRGADGRAGTAPQPGVTEVSGLVDRLRAAGVAVSLRLEGNLDAVPVGIALSAYRIAQEALSNAVRHAPGSAVDVRIAVADDLSLLVANGAGAPGPPGDPERTGHGLLGMRERVSALGGAIRVGPDERGGFIVAVTLPLDGV
ncbi:histidine kinase [Actinosynnema sp. NPDC020468]|uniref:sensor histidine kinase n=1 Tax=Actinosynnema sp. NPDC020468 TaxID=3154488 RepID=UPI0033F414E2